MFNKKNRITALLILIILTLFLVACENSEKDLEEAKKMKVKAQVMEVDEEKGQLIVRGLDLDSILGDKCVVEFKNGIVIDKTKDTKKELTIENIDEKDMIQFEVYDVEETYPTITKTDKIEIIKKDTSINNKDTTNNDTNRNDNNNKIVDEKTNVDLKDKNKEKTSNKNSDDKIKGVDNNSNTTNNIKKVIFKRLYDDVDTNNYNYLYEDSEGNGEFLEIKPIKVDIDKLDIISLEFDDDLVEKDVVKSFNNIKNGEVLLVDTYYPEGIPSKKIKWWVDGKVKEYIIQYNGKDDSDDYIEYNY